MTFNPESESPPEKPLAGEESQENPQDDNPRVKILKRGLHITRQILIIVGVIGLLVAFSFLFTGGFSSRALSDRLFWVGLIIMLLGVISIISITATGSHYGIPSMIRRPEEARLMMDHAMDIRKDIEKKYDLSIQLWVTGMLCIGLSILIDVVF